MDPGVRIEVSLTGRVNLAFHQNAVPSLRELVVLNDGEAGLSDGGVGDHDRLPAAVDDDHRLRAVAVSVAEAGDGNGMADCLGCPSRKGIRCRGRAQQVAQIAKRRDIDLSLPHAASPSQPSEDCT